MNKIRKFFDIFFGFQKLDSFPWEIYNSSDKRWRSNIYLNGWKTCSIYRAKSPTKGMDDLLSFYRDGSISMFIENHSEIEISLNKDELIDVYLHLDNGLEYLILSHGKKISQLFDFINEIPDDLTLDIQNFILGLEAKNKGGYE